MAPRVAIVLDHPQRDLAGITLTAFALCQHGVTCHLVPLNLVERETLALEPDFVLLNFIRRGIEPIVRAFKDAGIRFGVLDTEGGVWGSPEEYAELLWEDRALLDATRCACMWGPRMAEHVVARGILGPHQVRVTGCPRFDFYHPTWREVLLDEVAGPAPQSRAPGRGRILINTNFSLSNSRFVTADANARQLREHFGWTVERVTEYLETEQRAIAQVIELARGLSGDYPEATIVVRPHPFESPERYATALAECRNVVVNASGPVQPQIVLADVVIQRSCSTAIEAGLAAIPTLSPRWIPAPMETPMSEAVSEPCATYAELSERVGTILSGHYIPPPTLTCAIEQVIRDWFHAADGRAHERVCDTVLGALPARREVDHRACTRALYYLDHPSLRPAKRLANHLRYRLGVSPYFNFRRLRSEPQRWWAESDKAFGADTVRAVIARLGDAYRAQGRTVRPITVAPARDRGDYVNPFPGYSVTMSPAAEGA
jgi:surface carbohydrate biosynthesis protein